MLIISIACQVTKRDPVDPDAQPVPPTWPPDVSDLPREKSVYEYMPVPLSSISLVTARILKV